MLGCRDYVFTCRDSVLGCRDVDAAVLGCRDGATTCVLELLPTVSRALCFVDPHQKTEQNKSCL